jgi:SAM-dependent methyltransferase
MSCDEAAFAEALSRGPNAAPEALYALWEQAARSYKQFCALAAAVRPRLFDALDDTSSPEILAARLGIDPRLTADLCDLLVDMQVLRKNGHGFENTPLSRNFLRARSPYFQEEVMINIASGVPLWQRLDKVCRDGPIRVDQAEFFENNHIDSLAAEILTGELHQTTAAIVRQPGFQTARRMLDLGGGHGLYAMALCRHNCDLEAVVLDFPRAEAHFKRFKARFDGRRVTFVPGNLFADDFGSNFDLVLFSYNPGGKNARILEKIHGCLKPGGLFVSKHAFYRRDEGSKDKLLDIEWQLTAFEGIVQEGNVYRFAGDLCLEDYLALLERHFEVTQVVEAEAFATAPLAKFGDRLDSKIIVSRKRG